MPRFFRRSVFALAALGTVATLLLSGCVSAPERPTTSTPTGERVAQALQPYYEQVLHWSDCEEDFQCATVTAPLDWDDPARDSIELELIRSTATGDRLGSLLVNPGGPGGSGYEFIRDSLSFAVSPTLINRFDIVGFDPRGVGRSSAVSCYDDPRDMDEWLFGVPKNKRGTDARIEEGRAAAAAFGAACSEHTGELLGYVDTTSAAHDLDLLRAVLGDTKLNYLGFSYGTLLGASYAELYPKKTGRLVLDGAIDPATTLFDVSATQAMGFESALRAYLSECVGSPGCPFRGNVDGAMSTVSSLLATLDASPQRASDGRLLDANTMFTAIIWPLYNAQNWPLLNDLFDTVFAGRPDFAFALADNYYGRSDDGTYLDNSTEAFTAINCLDYVNDASNAELYAEADELAKLAPVFGPYMSFDVSCSGWPVAPKRLRDVLVAAGSAPILVVGTTNDPATPYQWSVNLAEQLENGHLITYEGEGHTAYNKSNSCVNNAVDSFFVSGTVPPADPRC